MMSFCTKCGAPMNETEQFCPNCGASVGSASVARAAYKPDTYEEPPQGSPCAVISSWSYVGTILLMGLPIAGLILTIVWACGGAHNINRRNLARANLLIMMLVAILYIVIAICVAAAGYSLFSLIDNLTYM